MVLRFAPYINMMFVVPFLIVGIFSAVFVVAMIGFKILDYFERDK